MKKEQLGGLMILEARDLTPAIQLMSGHPGLRVGCFEGRPAADIECLESLSRPRSCRS